MGKKQLIYDAVLKISNDGGLSSTPMSKIAKEADIAAGTIYRYFENKDQLLSELYTNITDELIKVIDSNYDKSSSSEDNINIIWKAILTFYLNNPLQIKFMQEYKASFNSSVDVIARSNDIFSLFTKVVHQAANEGVVKKISCAAMSSFIMGPISELFNYNASGIVEVNETIINESFEILWDGIKVSN